MGPQPGQLRHQISVIRKANVSDGQGGQTVTWTTLSTVWGRVEPLSGKELFAAQQVNAHTSHKIIIRYYSGLLQSDRIQFGTRQFNIRQIVNVDEIGRWHELIAEEFSE